MFFCLVFVIPLCTSVYLYPVSRVVRDGIVS